MDHLLDVRPPSFLALSAPAVSPFATPAAMRVSADALDAEDPAATLAGRFLLRHPVGTQCHVA
jgi:hypothetical protein